MSLVVRRPFQPCPWSAQRSDEDEQQERAEKLVGCTHNGAHINLICVRFQQASSNTGLGSCAEHIRLSPCHTVRLCPRHPPMQHVFCTVSLCFVLWPIQAMCQKLIALKHKAKLAGQRSSQAIRRWSQLGGRCTQARRP